MAKNPSVVQVVIELITPVADELGYFIWDVEFVKEGGKGYSASPLITKRASPLKTAKSCTAQ